MDLSPAPEAVTQSATHKSRTAARVSRALKRLVREPLLHFLLIGIALFALYDHFQRGRGGGESSDRIQLTFEDLHYLDLLFQSQWHRQPTPDEFNRLVEDRIQEEILYREGIAMGLDKEDTIVKRRMAQKLQFLAQDVAAAHEPTTAELESWYKKNTEKFAQPTRLSFRHLYFSSDKRGRNARDDAAKALGRLAGQPQDAEVAGSLADSFMLQDYYRDRPPEYLSKEFGTQFAQAVAKLAPGSWQGPIESGFGWHLVFVDTVIPGRFPAFEEIESEVKTTWLGEQKEQAWRKAYAEMRAKYTVSLPVVSDKGTASATARPPVTQIPTSSNEVPPL
jgi:peptidyl-prolyl cis-trans isomerase C